MQKRCTSLVTTHEETSELAQLCLKEGLARRQRIVMLRCGSLHVLAHAMLLRHPSGCLACTLRRTCWLAETTASSSSSGD
jgi:hypothetical protein